MEAAATKIKLHLLAFHAFDRALNQQQIEHTHIFIIKATQVKLNFCKHFMYILSLIANNKELKEWKRNWWLLLLKSVRSPFNVKRMGRTALFSKHCFWVERFFAAAAAQAEAASEIETTIGLKWF